jgi:hypothetical protein
MKKDALSLGRRNAPGASPGKGNQSTAFASNPVAGLRPEPAVRAGLNVFRGNLRGADRARRALWAEHGVHQSAFRGERRLPSSSSNACGLRGLKAEGG